MNTELSSKYDPSSVEAQASQVWMDEKCFSADPAAPGEPYCIVIPPPNVTGALHLGHAINATLQDILIRAHRMMGFNTLWVPGIDHAGIATQAVVEKQLKEQENKTRHDVGREGLVERIWKWKQQYGDRILEQLKRLGASCDWDRTRFTLDDMCAKAVRETFFKLFKDGLIYRGKRLVNWDTFLQTSISDDEIYHETVKTSLWHIRYPIEIDGISLEGGCPQPPLSAAMAETDNNALEGGCPQPPLRIASDARPPAVGSAPRTASRGNQESVRDVDPTTPRASAAEDSRPPVSVGSASADAVSPSPQNASAKADPTPKARELEHPTYMVVATTRPETMLGDTAVAVHSEDPRWNWAIGKHVRLPLTNRLIPIIADDILVDPKFGTGVVKVTPAHDPNDYAVWQRHKGQPDEIDLINILTPDGKITSDRPEWSKYAGMKRAAARTQVVEDLKSAGLLEKEEPYETQVGHSDRSKTPVEPYLSDQWFVKMAPLAEPALAAVREGKIKFHPERHAQQYLSWLGEKRDWPVSRQLWWGHRIPVWTKTMTVPAEPNPLNAIGRLASIGCKLLDEFRAQGSPTPDYVQMSDAHFARGPQPGTITIFMCPNDAAMITQLEQAGFIQDPDVLDTWFSSALWPHSTLGWPEQTADLARYYPTSVLLTGRDIITLWVARMVMMGMYNMGEKPAVEEFLGARASSPSSRANAAEDGRAPNAAEMIGAADSSLTPSPGTPGEGGGEGLSPQHTKSPHPNPLPAYRAREQEGTSHPVTPSPGHPVTKSSARRPEARTLGLPFLDVAINPTILDGKGERMSKSKGNGVDPVDIIDSYGADALRFTLTKMATETQDARMPVKRDANGKNTSDKFDEGRNFCNKLWNACRFALSNLENVGSASADAVSLGALSDEDLILLTQKGDKTAFPILYERYSVSVLSWLRGTLGNVGEAESICTEVFLRALRFCATYKYPHKFSTWLFTITRNVAIHQLRLREPGHVRNPLEGDLQGIDMTGDPQQVAARATDDLEKQEEIAHVLKALDALPNDQKEVIVQGVFAVGSASADAVSLLPRDASAMVDPTYTLADRWIIARFNRTLATCDEAIKSYRFDVYAKSCYDFFWGDFCDWYVEAIKPAMKDPARSTQTADVLAAVLDGALRLMHPMIPFITETVWWRLNDVRPHRGLPGRIECPPSKRLVLAKWPSAMLSADSAEQDFPRLQALISAIRTIRNDYQVNPKTTVEVYIKATGDASNLILANRELVEMLGTCTLKEVRVDLQVIQNAVTVSAAGCDIFATGLIDPNAEKARLLKESEAKKKLIETIEARMGNEAYIAKAPPKLVQQSREQLATAREELRKIEESLKKLE